MIYLSMSFLCSVRNGHIKRITDQDIQSSVLEIMGTNVSTNYITCPADPKQTLGIKLSFLVMIIKNVCFHKLYVSFSSFFEALFPLLGLFLFDVFCLFFFCQLRKYFTFEVMVLDDKNVRRRFRASTYQRQTRVKPFICTMPMRLDEVFCLFLCLFCNVFFLFLWVCLFVLNG